MTVLHKPCKCADCHGYGKHRGKLLEPATVCEKCRGAGTTPCAVCLDSGWYVDVLENRKPCNSCDRSENA